LLTILRVLGSLFDDSTTAWNVAHLGDLLPKLAPKACSIPGVVSPYLYFGMWRATFAWHVEDADLYSINYIHFGAPKFWYSVPQEQSEKFERVMEGESRLLSLVLVSHSNQQRSSLDQVSSLPIDRNVLNSSVTKHSSLHLVFSPTTESP